MGSEDWLNADSRLKYPVTFDADNREVYVMGEAYFQVNKDVNRPFYVVTDRVRIKVYGTEFNVNTRQQELFRTTLVNGMVGITVKTTGQEMIMKPNQMFEYDSRTGKCVLKDVDVYTYIAWKFGEFVFEDNRLEEVMDQLKVWYDVEVFYAGEEVKNVRFTGDATRFTNIADILSIIEKTGSVGFKINGRMVTVYNKE